jgi:transposase
VEVRDNVDKQDMDFNDFITTLIGYEKLAVLDFYVEPDKYHEDEKVFVATVALNEEELYRCPVCGQICGKYDSSGFIKRWRSLDLGKNKFFIECVYPRLLCADHGVKKCRIPWAFADSDYTQAFEVRVAYAAAKLPTSLVSREYRIKWGTVGNCVKRVQQNIAPVENRFRKLKKIAIDETSYRKGYKYITTVQDLETGEIIWASDGYGDEVLKAFFESLTEDQRAGIEYVVADGARWITRQVEASCPNAKRCVDPFHVVGWATEALDTARKRLSDKAKKNDSPS